MNRTLCKRFFLTILFYDPGNQREHKKSIRNYSKNREHSKKARCKYPNGQ